MRSIFHQKSPLCLQKNLIVYQKSPIFNQNMRFIYILYAYTHIYMFVYNNMYMYKLHKKNRPDALDSALRRAGLYIYVREDR